MGLISKIFYRLFYIEMTLEEIELEKLKKKHIHNIKDLF